MTFSFLPSWRLIGALGLLAPLSLLGAFAPAAGFAVLGLGLLLILVFGLEAWYLRREGPSILEIERLLPPALAVGESSTVALRIRNRSQRPLWLQAGDGCPSSLRPSRDALAVSIAPGSVEELSYEVCPLSRGSFRFDATEIRVQGPLGLAQHRFRLLLDDELRVHPNLRGLRRHGLRNRRELLTSGGGRQTRAPGRDGDFERLRDFVPGDDLRHVDWKATARLRRPITRVFQSEKAQNLIVLVDATRLMSARAADLTKMDFAVKAALMLSWVGLSRGDRVGVAVFDERIRAYVPPRPGPAQFGRILDLLYDQQPTLSFPRYREAARQVLRDNRRRSLVVWLTDLLDGEQGQELLGALRALRRRHLSLVVAMDDPDLHSLADREPQGSSGFFARAAASEALDERESLIRSLRNEGALVASSGPGGLTAAAVDQYLDLKQRGLL